MKKIIHMSYETYEENGYCRDLDLFNHLTSIVRFKSYNKQ